VLTLPELAEFVAEHHTRDLFRLETLPHYLTASDGDDLARYLRGESAPTAAAKAPWLDRLRRDVAEGRAWRVVHAIAHPLTDYVRYECEWGYAWSVTAGQQVRIADLSPSLAGVGDFFVLDHEHVVRSRYGSDHRFVGAEVMDDPAPYLAVADLVWAGGCDFALWWEAHPQYHRDPRAA
jgi:hypothetical protein